MVDKDIGASLLTLAEKIIQADRQQSKIARAIWGR